MSPATLIHFNPMLHFYNSEVNFLIYINLEAAAKVTLNLPKDPGCPGGSSVLLGITISGGTAASRLGSQRMLCFWVGLPLSQVTLISHDCLVFER